MPDDGEIAAAADRIVAEFAADRDRALRFHCLAVAVETAGERDGPAEIVAAAEVYRAFLAGATRH